MSYSADTAPQWRKSSHSGGTGGECVEVAATRDRLLIRDSKNPDAGHREMLRGAFAALVAGIKNA
ncbi:DUF397 domain-containing protein [Actinocorallia aurantiaca]|uniref:DUF397 domain-containing protein n=1 Tax=Actinocorallia aurantiaca TaxID=46204 RepID=A0ABN3UTR7_9ACTN